MDETQTVGVIVAGLPSGSGPAVGVNVVQAASSSLAREKEAYFRALRATHRKSVVIHLCGRIIWHAL